jgi:hypothetical protein
VDNNTLSTDTGGAIAAAMAFMGIWSLIILAGYVLCIWFFWRIFARAGMSGALALLNIIPFGTVVCLIILAFGAWPALEGRSTTTPGQATT